MNVTDVKPSVMPGVRLGRVSFVWRPWILCVTLLLATATFLVFCLSVGVGDFPISLSRVIATILGRGEQVDQFVIMDLRMPRALAGLVVGIALGVSGAITQSIARNPLASPDVLGITSGASAVAVFLVTVSGGTAAAIVNSVGLSAAALAGGLGTGLLVYFLAWRRGIDGFRLILIGISVSAVMQAITTWLLVTADIRDVAKAQAWLVGSLEDRAWGEVRVALWCSLVLLVVVSFVAFQFKPMHFGDEVAAGPGRPVRGGTGGPAAVRGAAGRGGGERGGSGPLRRAGGAAGGDASGAVPDTADGGVGSGGLVAADRFGPGRAYGTAGLAPGRRGHRRDRRPLPRLSAGAGEPQIGVQESGIPK